ncbi:MAG TPA: nucleoside-diphosphate kinase, partial [Methanocorpusculum sp.]|nr:nucleoside-diphosphate kinase [Methanocorpusculum sp.]
MERTFVMIKPDGVQRGLVGEILSRFEKKGFKIVAAKFGVLPEAIVDKHYEEHLAKPFYPGMKAYITSGPVFRFVLEGDNVIATVRKMNGAT